MKPLFRWTMYETSRQGLELFIEAICQTPKALGVDTFDWVVTYNGSDKMYNTVVNATKLSSVEINVIKQNPSNCPIPTGGKLLGMWKVTPPRLRPDAPEIICDNDIIFVKRFPKIDNFIETGRPLLVKDPIRFYGNLNHIHPNGENWNSGLLTLPSGFDFEEEIRKQWVEIGRPNSIGYAEEQALLTKIIKKMNPTIVEMDEIVELNKDGIPNIPGSTYSVTGKEYGFHFVESNRHFHKEAISFINRSNPAPPIPIY
jgi:hypothetical protein